MVNLYYNIKNNIKAKSYSLRCIGVGSIFFLVLYAITKIFKCSLCPIKKLFGVSCFGCGMTRAFICILKFDFISAINYNVLSLPLFFGIVIYLITFFFDILLGKDNVEKMEMLLSKKYMYIIYIITLISSLYINKLI